VYDVKYCIFAFFASLPSSAWMTITFQSLILVWLMLFSNSLCTIYLAFFVKCHKNFVTIPCIEPSVVFPRLCSRYIVYMNYLDISSLFFIHQFCTVLSLIETLNLVDSLKGSWSGHVNHVNFIGHQSYLQNCRS